MSVSILPDLNELRQRDLCARKCQPVPDLGRRFFHPLPTFPLRFGILRQALYTKPYLRNPLLPVFPVKYAALVVRSSSLHILDGRVEPVLESIQLHRSPRADRSIHTHHPS